MPRDDQQDQQNNQSLKERVYQRLLDLSPKAQEDLVTSNAKIRETASHDFTAYEFLYDPLLLSQSTVQLTFEERQLLHNSLKAAVSSGIVQHFVQIGVDADFEGRSLTIDGEWFREETAGMDDEGLSRRLFKGPFKNLALPMIIEARNAIPEEQQDAWFAWFVVDFSQGLTNLFKEKVNDEFTEEELNEFLFSDDDLWESITQDTIGDIASDLTIAENTQSRTRTFGHSSFTPFEPDTVNFGLQLVYRQVWIPLGTQAGEVVKTIPLGPGQTERISIKSLRRRKKTNSFEESTETESSSEVNETSRDSSEVVDTASSTFQWNTDISASANWGWGSAQVSASLGGDKSNTSSSTKNNLNEAMSKTADKLRTQTKVKVSTEGVDEVESTSSSEITNPNDEVAVTYVYSKLQRQYEIHTYLAEVNTVVFVATEIPTRAEMTPAWFGKHSHILRPALMNDTFAKDLDSILSHNPYGQNSSEVSTDNFYKNIVATVSIDGLPDFSQTAGTPPDYVASAMEMYDRDKERSRANKQAQRSYEKSLDRLSEHIAENALHYGRAFWQAKDTDTRMMEYGNIRVPTEWRYQASKIDYESGKVTRPGGYVPKNSDIGSMARLSDLVNPAGPIGHAGNYLAFYLRSDTNFKDLQAPLAAMRIPYLKRTINIDAPENLIVNAVPSHSYPIPSNGINIELSLQELSSDALTVSIRATTPGRDYIRNETAEIANTGGELEFTMLKLHLQPTNGLLQVGTVLMAQARILPVLEDPELGYLRWELGTEIFRTGEELFNIKTIAALSSGFPEVEAALDTLNSGNEPVQWSQLDNNQQHVLQSHYADHLLRERHTRRFLLDTDNVFLTRIIDNNSSLEPFKDVHRNLDILRTIEDIEQLQIETERLSSRVDASDFSDPDVQTRTVVVEKGTDVDVNT